MKSIRSSKGQISADENTVEVSSQFCQSLRCARSTGNVWSVGSAERSSSKLRPFTYTIFNGADGRPIASGNLFAGSPRQAQTYARIALEGAVRALSYSFNIEGELPLDILVKAQERPLPLPSPPVLAFRQEDWMMFAAELILKGLPIFGARDKTARRALRCGVVDTYVASIIETDPIVRQSRATMKKVSWELVSAHLPRGRGVVRAALHLTADGEPVPLSPTTVMAVLCVLLRSANYNRKTGLTAHRDGAFPVPSSATARAAIAQRQLANDGQRAALIRPVQRYLRLLGLDCLAVGIQQQANLRVSAPRSAISA